MMRQLKICRNDVIMGKKEFEENLNVQIGNPSVEIERNKNEEKEIEEVVKMNLKKLHAQKNIQTSWENISMSRGFYCVNNNTTIDLENAKTMHCILCDKNPIDNYNESKNTSRETNNFLLLKKWNNFS